MASKEQLEKLLGIRCYQKKREKEQLAIITRCKFPFGPFVFNFPKYLVRPSPPRSFLLSKTGRVLL